MKSEKSTKIWRIGLAKNVNVLGKNVNTINKNTVGLSGAEREVYLAVNTEKNPYMVTKMQDEITS
jgi:hypothetical protein